MAKKSAQSKPQPKNPYKGVRLRPSGKWSAEIRDPREGRIWIGSYYTAEEACRAFDLRAREIGFPNSKLNFPDKIPSPPSRKCHPRKTKNRAQLPRDSLENVQPNNILKQDSSNGLNSNPIDLDLPYDFITVNGNLNDSCYWPVLHQEQTGPNTPYIPSVEPAYNVQQKHFAREDSSINSLNNSVDWGYIYSLIGGANLDLSLYASAMEDGPNTTAIPYVDSQLQQYSLPAGAGDLNVSSGWSSTYSEIEMENGLNTSNSNQKLNSNFLNAVPGAREQDRIMSEFEHLANGDASGRENGKSRDSMEFGGVFSERKDDKKRKTRQEEASRMEMEEEILERQLDIEQKKVLLEERRVAAKEERIKLQREKEEIGIMMMDTSTMNEVQKKYIESLQSEICIRRIMGM